MHPREVERKFKFKIKQEKVALQRQYLEESDVIQKQELLKQIQIISSIEISSSGLWNLTDTGFPTEEEMGKKLF
jgi:hypothetical protein